MRREFGFYTRDEIEGEEQYMTPQKNDPFIRRVHNHMDIWQQMVDNGLHETSFITGSMHNLTFSDDERPDRNRRYSAWITM